MNVTYPISANKPFAFYDDLLFNNSISNVLNLFYDESKITKNHHLVIERNKEFTFESWVGNNDTSDLIDYDKHFKLVLNHNTRNAFESLDLLLGDIKDPEKINCLHSQLNILNSCIEKNKTEDWNEFNEIIQIELFSIITEIQLKYTHLITYHKVFVKIQDNTDGIDSIFSPKQEVKRSFFKKLHSLLIDLDMIDDIVVNEDSFLDVFTSVKPQIESQIRFIKPNPIVAYLLKSLEPFFYNFNAVTIEKSQCFKNKQGKLFQTADLYTAISRGKDKYHNEFNKIDLQISKLQKEYLK